MVSRKVLALALVAVATAGAFGLVSQALNSYPYGICCPGPQITEGLSFSTGYNRTSDGFVFVVHNIGNNSVAADLLFVNMTKVSFSISPATPGSNCNTVTRSMGPGDHCLMAATTPEPPSGPLGLKFTMADGATFDANLQPNFAHDWTGSNSTASPYVSPLPIWHPSPKLVTLRAGKWHPLA